MSGSSRLEPSQGLGRRDRTTGTARTSHTHQAEEQRTLRYVGCGYLSRRGTGGGHCHTASVALLAVSPQTPSGFVDGTFCGGTGTVCEPATRTAATSSTFSRTPVSVFALGRTGDGALLRRLFRAGLWPVLVAVCYWRSSAFPSARSAIRALSTTGAGGTRARGHYERATFCGPKTLLISHATANGERRRLPHPHVRAVTF